MLYVPMWVVEVIWWFMRWNELIWGTTYNNEATIDWLVSDSVYEWRCNRVGCSYFAVAVHQRDFYASTQSRNWDSVKTTRSSSPAPGSSAQVCITRHDTTWHTLKELSFQMWVSLDPSECRTRWFDHDDPTRNGDYEVLSDLQKIHPGEICQQPIAIEVQTVSGEPASNTSDAFLKWVWQRRSDHMKERRRGCLVSSHHLPLLSDAAMMPPMGLPVRTQIRGAGAVRITESDLPVRKSSVKVNVFLFFGPNMFKWKW